MDDEITILTRSITHLERILDAPGVENESRFDFLVDAACRFMQRFHELAGYSWGEYKEITS